MSITWMKIFFLLKDTSNKHRSVENQIKERVKCSCILALIHVNWAEKFTEVCSLDIQSNIGAFAKNPELVSQYYSITHALHHPRTPTMVHKMKNDQSNYRVIEQPTLPFRDRVQI